MRIMKCHEAMYTQYSPVCETKMPVNVHYVPIRQTYCSPNILRMQHMVHNYAHNTETYIHTDTLKYGIADYF